jgi:hypothetical protein
LLPNTFFHSVSVSGILAGGSSPKVYEFLKEFQTPFAWFDSDYKQVKISITEYAKEFFKFKKH